MTPYAEKLLAKQAGDSRYFALQKMLENLRIIQLAELKARNLELRAQLALKNFFDNERSEIRSQVA